MVMIMPVIVVVLGFLAAEEGRDIHGLNVMRVA
jgi:hypothetical protein